MVLRIVVRLAIVIAVFGAAAVGLFLPTETAHACLPCVCPDYRSVNCFGDYAVYTPETARGCAIDVFALDSSGQGQRAFVLTPRQLARIPADLDQSALIAQEGLIALYALPNDQFLINWGPDEENKMFEMIFTVCPTENLREQSYPLG